MPDLRLVLDRLKQEGLLTARSNGGFVAAEFSVQDIHDGIEIRGMLEGTAARLAAERLERQEDLADTRKCLTRIDRLLQRLRPGTDALAQFMTLNEQFHTLLLDLARSAVLRRAVHRAVALPFASPNALIPGNALTQEGKNNLFVGGLAGQQLRRLEVSGTKVTAQESAVQPVRPRSGCCSGT